ncbi:shikimate dehydrogenase [Desulfobacterales bacterium HSG16]|nr:shikimate dehydrogenase [Desulfobacterales bacterium HSG16]
MQVYCILGDERALRSKSSAMFSAILTKMGMNGAYVPFKVLPENLGKAMQSLEILNIAGANVTVPYKEAVLPYMDVLSEGANIIGAVNTVVCTDDGLKGYNTNAIGVMDALSSVDFDVSDKSALVFGTGGVSKAVVFILNWLRAKTIIVAGRNFEKAEQIVKRFSGEAKPLDSIADHPMPVDVVFNTTSVSSKSESSNMDGILKKLDLPGCQLVFDLNYGRSQNFWEEMAQKKEIRFMDGLPALAYQARRTFALWTRAQVPPEEFLNALNENNL